jgi:hypothetical protein
MVVTCKGRWGESVSAEAMILASESRSAENEARQSEKDDTMITSDFSGIRFSPLNNWISPCPPLVSAFAGRLPTRKTAFLEKAL